MPAFLWGCGRQGADRGHSVEDPIYLQLEATVAGFSGSKTVRFEVWWADNYVTRTNSSVVGVPDRIVIAADGDESPLEPFEANLDLALVNFGPRRPYLVYVTTDYTYPKSGTYKAQAWVYAGDKVGYHDAWVRVGESSAPAPQGQTEAGNGQGGSPPPPDYGDTSQVREVIIALIYMLEQERGELPPEPPNLH